MAGQKKIGVSECFFEKWGGCTISGTKCGLPLDMNPEKETCKSGTKVALKIGMLQLSSKKGQLYKGFPLFGPGTLHTIDLVMRKRSNQSQGKCGGKDGCERALTATWQWTVPIFLRCVFFLQCFLGWATKMRQHWYLGPLRKVVGFRAPNVPPPRWCILPHMEVSSNIATPKP